MTPEEIRKANNDWLQRTWRPAVGVTYIIINVFDFILFPILWSMTGLITNGVVTPWHPLTLDSTGLFHLAFGAILGVAAWSRGKEKSFELEYDREPDYRRTSYSRSKPNPNRSYTYDNDMNNDYPEQDGLNINSSTFRGENER